MIDKTSYITKPEWLNKKISLGACSQVKELLKDMRLHTVCEEALCPNMGECFARRQATFIILGAVCTRSCRFCGISKGRPLPADSSEPKRVAEAVSRLGLNHAVITSVTRDDLADGGAALFAETVSCVRSLGGVSVETLIPDFKAERSSLRVLAEASPDIIAHNVETVPALYGRVRPNGAVYERSLEVLRILKETVPRIPLKSGLMLGLGEKKDEVLAVFDDLVSAGCEFLSIGQYLAPSKEHFPVQEYIKPEAFEEYREAALARGFAFVKSGPYVRSSYCASDYRRALQGGRISN
jgi:lipoic acid synthetase